MDWCSVWSVFLPHAPCSWDRIRIHQDLDQGKMDGWLLIKTFWHDGHSICIQMMQVVQHNFMIIFRIIIMNWIKDTIEGGLESQRPWPKNKGEEEKNHTHTNTTVIFSQYDDFFFMRMHKNILNPTLSWQLSHSVKYPATDTHVFVHLVTLCEMLGHTKQVSVSTSYRNHPYILECSNKILWAHLPQSIQLSSTTALEKKIQSGTWSLTKDKYFFYSFYT